MSVTRAQLIGNVSTGASFSGIVTATGGFNLGISSAGSTITAGPIKTLNFVGTGNTFAVSGTTVDISISGGGGGGLGTALSSDQSSALNKIYYVDKVLGVTTTITVDPPATSMVAFTQYPEIRVDAGADFIVADGDDFIPNILGIGTTGALPALGGGGGRVRADNFANNTGTGAPTFTAGLNVTGVLTSTTLAVTGNATISGNLTVNGTQTIINTQTLDVADKTIGIGSTSTPSDSLADGAGIIVYGTTNKSLLWYNTNKNWGLVGGGLSITSGNVLIGAATSTGTASQPLQVTGGAYVSGTLGIGTTNPAATGVLGVAGTITELSSGQYWNVVSQADVGIGASQVPLNQYLGQLAFVDEYSPNILLTPRIQSVGEKTTLISGNTVTLTYNTGGGNIAICTNPSGDITLNVVGIPTDSSFDNTSLTFSVFVNQTGTARSCTAVNLNGVSETIRWAGGSLAAAISGVTTTSGFDIYSFTGINTVGSASTAANYVVLGVVNGGYR